MLPDVILHNSISIDGSLVNFEVNMGLHYHIAGKYKPDVHLIGSNTIKTGIGTYGGVSPEKKNDFHKPDKNSRLPYWVIIDTRGILRGQLHALRSFEFCKDVIILLSEKTPREYIEYLEKRNYDYHIVGRKQVDVEKSLELLSKEYSTKTILTDTGRKLGNLLLNRGLVKEVSLLIHPVIVGIKAYNIFGDINTDMKLKLSRNEMLEEGYIWSVYKVEIDR